MQRALGLDAALHLEQDIMAINQGSVVEQFVGQQLPASTSPYDERAAFYWSREKKSSQAEVDYLAPLADKIYPIEVKSGKTGKLKSLRLFLDEHPQSPFGIRFSLHELSWHDNLLSIPLYMANHWPRLVKELDVQ